MNQNDPIIYIAAVVGIMIAAELAVTLAVSNAFAIVVHGGKGGNGINCGGNNGNHNGNANGQDHTHNEHSKCLCCVNR